MSGEAPTWIWPQQHSNCFWKAYLLNWDSCHCSEMTLRFYEGVTAEADREVLGNLMVLTAFYKFLTLGQVIYILCSFTVNKFVFLHPSLSCDIPFETVLITTSPVGRCLHVLLEGKLSAGTWHGFDAWGKKHGFTSASCCPEELARRSTNTCEYSGDEATLQGLPADFTAGTGARGIPVVICRLEAGEAELLSCQEYDFWLQLFLPSRSCPPHNTAHASWGAPHTAHFSHIMGMPDFTLFLYF